MPTLLRVCSIDATQPDPPIRSGHLHLGGSDPNGNRLGLTNSYLTWNDRPLYVISGEFHYSRYPEADWEEELLKVKAGGVNVVATYIFWNFHEETQGCFDWEGRKNIRRFVELCNRHELFVILRIGPFVHGEWRNGGLPDWLYGQPFEVRSNDPEYLACVERYYAEIGRQVQGLMFKDGGPVIGIQLDNEYMHAGAPWEVVEQPRDLEWITAGREGAEHLKALKALAHQAKLDTPLYLVTAWGAPIIEDETLPVYGGYAYPVWIDDPGPSSLYLFQDGHAHPVDADAVTHRVPNYYPLIYAEMQGGIQIRYRNRPLVTARSVEALALVCVGNGSNWLGYYMYHGGTTPAGQRGFNHERLHPQLSYDFQAPLGEYGEYHPSYHALRLLHLFLAAYGEVLGAQSTILPANAARLKPEDTSEVRYCIRSNNGSGFLFVNNFQDHAATQDFPDVAFEIKTSQDQVTIPQAGGLTVKADSCFILPFNQKLGAAHLHYATAQPLTVLTYSSLRHFFSFVPEGLEAEYCFDSNTITSVSGDCDQQSSSGKLILTPKVGQNHFIDIETTAGDKLRLTTLSRPEAEHTWKGKAWGVERVIVSEADLFFVEDRIETQAMGINSWAMTVWPPFDATIKTRAQCEQKIAAARTELHLSTPKTEPALQVKQISARKYLLKFPQPIPTDLAELFLKIDYEGDTGMAFINGCLVADNFNNGTSWLIGLKRFKQELLNNELCLVFSPLRQGVVKNTSSQFAGRFEFEGQEKLTINSITLIPQYRICLEAATP